MSEITRLTTVEIAKQALNFSIAHFTIFSATNREDLHGHNFQLECKVTAPLAEDGLLFDYGILKRLLRALCDEIDEQVILPGHSPYLQLSNDDGYTIAHFNGERIPFLPRDVTVLPIANTTVEEFSHYFLEKLKNDTLIQQNAIVALSVKVSSSPGQYGIADWRQA
ncbi:MAG: 6-pyruvoyltetrahydropterin/6-carboxytetrahydropterin synthase [Candidatus Azotimanducaceae bacterium]|jgi:6-pyruvoyltetrahydropterin/6-carboxytetrahydropterin synthase